MLSHDIRCSTNLVVWHIQRLTVAALFIWFYIKAENQRLAADEAVNDYLYEKIQKDKYKFENLDSRVTTILNVEGCPASIIKEMDILIAEYAGDNRMMKHIDKNKIELLNKWESRRNSIENNLKEDCRVELKQIKQQ